MAEPIGPYSPEELIDVIETDLIDASVSLGRTEEGVVFRGSDVTWVYTGYKSLSRIMRARFNPEEAEDRVAEIFDCFKQWDAPVSWVVGPSTYPPQLHDYLRDNGFGNGGTWTGLAMDVKKWSAAAPSAGLRVDLVDEPDTLMKWTMLPTVGWETDDEGGTPLIFSPENAGGDPKARYYLATTGGKPVGRLMAYCKGDVVGLHWPASTGADTPAIERMLIDRAMSDASDAGCVVAVAVTSQPSSLESAGFQQYCQFAVYAWPPAPIKITVC